jgi:hypothetical protein
MGVDAVRHQLELAQPFGELVGERQALRHDAEAAWRLAIRLFPPSSSRLENRAGTDCPPRRSPWFWQTARRTGVRRRKARSRRCTTSSRARARSPTGLSGSSRADQS